MKRWQAKLAVAVAIVPVTMVPGLPAFSETVSRSSIVVARSIFESPGERDRPWVDQERQSELVREQQRFYEQQQRRSEFERNQRYPGELSGDQQRFYEQQRRRDEFEHNQQYRSRSWHQERQNPNYRGPRLEEERQREWQYPERQRDDSRFQPLRPSWNRF